MIEDSDIFSMQIVRWNHHNARESRTSFSSIETALTFRWRYVNVHPSNGKRFYNGWLIEPFQSVPFEHRLKIAWVYFILTICKLNGL